jgi:hypothetical protein
MGKRKGSNAKAKDPSHSRKHPNSQPGGGVGGLPQIPTATSKQPDEAPPGGLLESSLLQQSQQASSSSLRVSGTNNNNNGWLHFTFRCVYQFVTKVLPCIVVVYFVLGLMLVLWDLRHEIQPLLVIRPVAFRRPSTVLRQFRTAVYDTIFFRRSSYYYDDNDIKKYPPSMQQQQSHVHQNKQRWYFSRSRNNERFLDDSLGSDPTPRNILFSVLREAIVREPGGYVHPDLGILQPAPSGAVRGIGMVRDSYHRCQTECFPGSDLEDVVLPMNSTTRYKQQDVLIRVPLSYQMNRKAAIEAIVPLLPSADRAANMADLDDPTLLVLLLAHERSKMRYSRWYPYIASLPPQPSCGYWRESRDEILQSLATYRARYQLDADGWEDELYKATEYSETIVRQLAVDYGPYLFKDTKDATRIYRRIAWALCHVASRATAAYNDHGSLRMIPMLDMINHDLVAGAFLELTGKETVANGDPLNASSDDEGTFIVRSLRHGRRKPLKVGQELLVNYNVPNYSPLDWFVSMGYVPPERRSPWIKIDPVLPQLRNEHGQPFATAGSTTAATIRKSLLKPS